MLTFFGHIWTILAWTKCRLVTKHLLSSTHFHSCFFLTFPFKFYLYKKIKLSIKDYLLLIYMFMSMIIFLRIVILSFQSHQTRILTAGLGMAWNRDGLSWTYPPVCPFQLSPFPEIFVTYSHNLCNTHAI